MPARKIFSPYFIEMSGSLLLFGLSVIASVRAAHQLPEGIVRKSLLISPIPAFLLVMWAVLREVQRNGVKHERKIWVSYVVEMWGGFALYALALVLVHRFGFPMREGTARTLVLVSPMLPVLLVVWAIARQIQRVDEYGRKQVLETIALAFGITAGCSMTYGFLENAGFPKLSMFVVWPIMATAWILVALVRLIRGR